MLLKPNQAHILLNMWHWWVSGRTDKEQELGEGGEDSLSRDLQKHTEWVLMPSTSIDYPAVWLIESQI